MSEWYPENLEALLAVMKYIPELALVEGVHEIEVRVRVDDMETWAVIGYGESGDPCVLRFEEPVKPIIVKPNPFTLYGSSSTVPNIIDCQNS